MKGNNAKIVLLESEIMDLKQEKASLKSRIESLTQENDTILAVSRERL